MENLTIVPYVGVGPLRLGMTRSEIRQRIGNTFKTFTRGDDPADNGDAFDDAGIYAYYDARGECEAIELASPSAPTLFGVKMVGVPFSQVLTYLTTHDASVEVDDSGATAHSIGVGLYAPLAGKEKDAGVEGIIVFRRGYYD